MRGSAREILDFVDAFAKREGRAPTYTEMEGGTGYSRAHLHRRIGELTAAGKLRRSGHRSAFEVVGARAPDPVEMRECLLRLKTECEVEGLASRAGFDCWLAMANRVLGTVPSRPVDGDPGRRR